MNTFFIAATDKMSWGRGTREWEAIAHGMIHAGMKADKMIIFRVDAPEGAKESDIYVNETGSIVAPAGTEVKELGVIDAKRINSKLSAYLDTVDKIIGEV